MPASLRSVEERAKAGGLSSLAVATVLAVGAKGRRSDNAFMLHRLADRFAGRRVPKPRGVVVARGRDGLAVGAEGRGSDIAFMLQRLADRFAGRRVPSRAVSSLLAVATILPSGLKVTAKTQPSCFIGSPIGLPVAASHSCAVLSSLAVAMVLPSGLKVAAIPSLHASTARRSVAGRRVPKPRGLVVARCRDGTYRRG